MTEQEPLFILPDSAELPADVWVLTGDCVEVMADMEEASIDAVVCDPPYGLEFMGKEWDNLGGNRTVATGIGERDTPWVSNQGWNGSRCRSCGHLSHGGSPCACDNPDFGAADDRWRRMQAWHEVWAAEAFRVLKPGGHLLAFGGTRTSHRMVCAIEDAGFEIRDSVTWIYGSGFPKSMSIGKAIDKAAGAERTEVIGVKAGHEDFVDRTDSHAAGGRSDGWDRPWRDDQDQVNRSHQVLAAATPEAAMWDGWGTALKPAHEPIVLARKPLIGTVAKNVLLHGTGGLNIDGCRVSVGDEVLRAPQSDPGKRAGVVGSDLGFTGQDTGTFQQAQADSIERTNRLGRWPANVVFTHSAGCVQVGERQVKSSEGAVKRDTAAENEGNTGPAYGKESRPGGTKMVGYGQETIPAYDCVDGCPVAELDAQSGVSKSTGGRTANISTQSTIYGDGEGLGQDFDADDVRGDPGYGDVGGASRFFQTFRADPLCGLWGMLSGCQHVLNVVTPSSQNERVSGSAPGPAQVAPPLYPEDSEARQQPSANTAAPASERSSVTEENTAQSGAPPKRDDSLVQAVKSAGSLCDSCATVIAQSLVAMQRGQTPASTLGAACTSESHSRILSHSLALIAGVTGRCGTTMTTDDLSTLFGYVGGVINSDTISGSRPSTSSSAQRSFRYQGKASRSERNAGLGHLPASETRRYGDRSQGALLQQTPQTTTIESNNHPTVKPVALMRYLVRLVTPPGGLVLDPFAGSGTTGIAAVLEQHPFIGIEKSAEYVSIAKARIAWANQQKGRT